MRPPPDVRVGCDLEHDRGVSHTLINDPASEVTIQAGAVVSKVVHRGDGLDVTVAVEAFWVASVGEPPSDNQRGLLHQAIADAERKVESPRSLTKTV